MCMSFINDMESQFKKNGIKQQNLLSLKKQDVLLNIVDAATQQWL